MLMKKKAGKAAAKKRSARTAQFLQKPTCTTCRKARAYMEDRGFALHFRDLDKERLSSDELEKLIGDRDHRGIGCGKPVCNPIRTFHESRRQIGDSIRPRNKPG